jgi:GNAT superfamily N-acetyltransferase
MRAHPPTRPSSIPIRPATPADAPWVSAFLRERWNSTTIEVHGEAIDAAALPALIAGDRQGLATYRIQDGDAELVTLDAEPAGAKIGTALIKALVAELLAAGCARLWLTTTTDKRSALRFYMRCGFHVMQLRYGAVERARERKPSIPEIGGDGIPMRDEVDLCCALSSGIGPRPPPWSRPSASAEGSAS